MSAPDDHVATALQDDGASAFDDTFLDQLRAFLDRVREDGIAIEPDQYSHILRLLADGPSGQNQASLSERMARRIVPILAGTPEQQRICHAHFRSVFSGEEPPGLSPTSSNRATKNRGRELERKVSLSPTFLKGVAVVAGAMFLALAVILSGSFSFNFGGKDEEIASSGKQPPISVRDIPDWVQEYPIEELELPKQLPWNRTWRWYYTEYDWKKWLALLAPWTLYAAAIALLIHLTLAHLRRENLKENLKTRLLRFAGDSPRFGNRDVISTLQPLRTLPRSYVRRLDPVATAKATAEAGGLLVLRYVDEPVPTDFVALIDRRGPRDHLASYSEAVVTAMRSAGLFVEQFDFYRDPRACRSQRTGEIIGLKAAVAAHPDAVFIIFLAEEELVNPGTGQAREWLAEMDRVDKRFLVLPQTDFQDGDGAFAGMKGFGVLEAAPSGLRRLTRRLIGIDKKKAAYQQDEGTSSALDRFVERISHRAERWSQTSALSEKEIDQTLEELQDAIGADGFAWVAATAVYPELHWPMTVHLKRILADSDGAPSLDGTLIRITRLPWFRRGWMPDWLRSALVRHLNRTRRRHIHDWLLSALGLGPDRPRAVDQMSIASLRHKKSETPPRSDDRILLDYLLPRLNLRDDVFSLPDGWARRFARKPIMRLTIVAMIGAGLTGMGSLIALSLLDINECDLWGSVHHDPLRVGPGFKAETIRRSGNLDVVLEACAKAVIQHPDNLRLQYQLSRAKHINPSDDESVAKIFNEMSRLAEKGYPVAIGHLADMFERGMGVEKDEKKAFEYHQRAIRRGAKEELYDLAKLIQYSDDPDISNLELFLDTKKKMLKEGVVSLSVIALAYRDGIEFASGEYLEENYEEYLKITRLGAKRKDFVTASELGAVYELGDLGEVDLESAVYWYEKSIQWGANDHAAFRLAEIYSTVGHPDFGIDYDKAARWGIFAAKAGESRALPIVESLLFSGKLDKSTVHSVRVAAYVAQWAKAAEAGEKRAQYYYGRYLVDARELVAEGRSWLEKSAAQGYQKAIDKLDELGER